MDLKNENDLNTPTKENIYNMDDTMTDTVSIPDNMMHLEETSQNSSTNQTITSNNDNNINQLNSNSDKKARLHLPNLDLSADHVPTSSIAFKSYPNNHINLQYSPTSQNNQIMSQNSNSFGNNAAYASERSACLNLFDTWSEADQVDFVQHLLHKMCHFQHGLIDSFLKPMLQRDFLSLLPKFYLDHLAEKVLAYLDAQSLAHCEAVCKEWNRVIAQGALWKKLIEQKVEKDSLWAGLAKRRAWKQYLYKAHNLSQSLSCFQTLLLKFYVMSGRGESILQSPLALPTIIQNNNNASFHTLMMSFLLQQTNSQNTNYFNPEEQNKTEHRANNKQNSPPLNSNTPASKMALQNAVKNGDALILDANFIKLMEILLFTPNNQQKPQPTETKLNNNNFISKPLPDCSGDNGQNGESSTVSKINSPSVAALILDDVKTFIQLGSSSSSNVKHGNCFETISSSPHNVNGNNFESETDLCCSNNETRANNVRLLTWFYKRLYGSVLHDISTLQTHWKEGQHALRRIKCRSENSKGVYCLQYDDTKIVSGLRDNTIKIWDYKTLECLKVLTGHTGSVLCLQYDENIIVTGSSDATVRIWDVNNGEMLNTLIHHCEAVLHLRFDEGVMVTCSKDRSIAVWDMRSSKDISLRRVLVGHRAAVNVVDFDAKYIVSASGDRTIKVWDTATCEFVRTLNGHKRGIACLQYRDRLIVSGSSDYTIRLWDVECGSCLRILEGHEELVRCIRFDNKRIVSGAYDGKIKVWDLVSALDPRIPSSSVCVKTLVEHTGRVFRLQFDEFQIVSSSHDDTILIWDFLNYEHQSEPLGGLENPAEADININNDQHIAIENNMGENVNSQQNTLTNNIVSNINSNNLNLLNNHNNQNLSIQSSSNSIQRHTTPITLDSRANPPPVFLPITTNASQN